MPEPGPTARHRRLPVMLACLPVVLALVLTGCTTDPSTPSASGSATARPTTARPTAARPTAAASPAPGTSTRSEPSSPSSPSTPTRPDPPAAPSSGSATAAAGSAPVIVIDPGHSPTVDAVDERTGLVVSDYENEPEMRDVFAVATIVAARLRAVGYRVVMTKTSVRQRRTLAQRAEIADDAHAALAVSIHDQAGSDGGIGFRAGNNTVYYQSVGTYRATPSGRHVTFRNAALAAISKRYGTLFAAQRARVQRTRVALRGNTGYDLGSRGLAAGDIWMVQLLSRVPWIYNEAGGNSAGRIGLSAADRTTYAAALVASVERCVPPPLPVPTSASPASADGSGTLVTVHGANFRHVTAVFFGSTASPRVRTVSATTLRVMTPAHAPGATTIRVRTRNGLSTARVRFTYVAA